MYVCPSPISQSVGAKQPCIIDGIVVCKSDDGTLVLSVVVDDNIRIISREVRLHRLVLSARRSSAPLMQVTRTVEVMIRDTELDAWMSHCYIDFDTAADWVECARVLHDAKSHIAIRTLELEDQLAVVRASQFLCSPPGSDTGAGECQLDSASIESSSHVQESPHEP